MKNKQITQKLNKNSILPFKYKLINRYSNLGHVNALNVEIRIYFNVENIAAILQSDLVNIDICGMIKTVLLKFLVNILIGFAKIVIIHGEKQNA